MRRRHINEYDKNWSETTEGLEYVPTSTQRLWQEIANRQMDSGEDFFRLRPTQTHIPIANGYETVDPARALMVMPYSPCFKPCGIPTEEC